MERISKIISVNVEDTPVGSISRYKLNIISDGLSNPVYLPLIVARGRKPGPVLCLTAALHGNEINGVPVIQKIFKDLNVDDLTGSIIGVPVININGFLKGERRFSDKVDLNHKMPGKELGNRSDIYAYRIFNRIIHKSNYLIDLHTASFGRVNTYYVRADLSDEVTKKISLLQNADIVLNNKGKSGTLRRAATDKGIVAITVELRDPNKFQKDVIDESCIGIFNMMRNINMLPGEIITRGEESVICKKSYWVYTQHGGILSVLVDLSQLIKKDQKIALIKNMFGDVIHEYFSPEDGIVIGKSINPVSQTGSRIIHLGIIE